MRFPLQGKVVFITGASGGIGAALALECGRRGARVALASRDLKKTKAVARLLDGARIYLLDVTRASQVKRVARQAIKDFGRVDVLINNAGVHLFAKVEDLPENMLEKALNTNVFGPIRLIQAFLPGMKKRGSGMIVQISSTLAFRAIPNAGGYAATKGALARLTESLRVELMGTGVQVLDAAPGVVLTRLRERAYIQGVKPAPQSKLPFPRSAEATAKEIVGAMEAGRRDIMSAAWPVRFTMKFVNWIAPAWIDRQFFKN
jgi:short-subunit dehydrogenase